MTTKPKGVVLVSGGMDSCVTLAIAQQTHDLALVHASYGQRTERRERQAFEAMADYFGVRERMVVRLDHFTQIGGSALTDKSIAVPLVGPAGAAPKHGVRETTRVATGAATGAGEIPVTYVPFRNAHFLSVAVSWAEVLGANAVFIGAVAQDSSGYPDCRPEYYRVFEELVRVGTKPETHIRIVTPVIEMRKSEIVKRAMELGAPLRLTWSCYQVEDQACGECDSCRLRLEAFRAAGIEDPIPYRGRLRDSGS